MKKLIITAMKTYLNCFLLLSVLFLPIVAYANYVQLTDGVYQDGSTIYIGSNVTSLDGLQLNPSVIYCYATIPPACVSNTFTGFDAALHVPAAGMVSYFTALYWYNFNNITADAVEPQSVTLNVTSAEVEIGESLTLSSSVYPANATPASVMWFSTDVSVAKVSDDGKVTAVGIGECDIIAACVDKEAVCHIVVVPDRVTIILDRHDALLLPNHTITLNATCSPATNNLSVTSSDYAVAIPRYVNGTIMVVGVGEGTATITVSTTDGWCNSDACEVTVYTEIGDVNCDGFINISDVTKLVDYLLGANVVSFSERNADIKPDGDVNIADVTALIDFLLAGAEINPPVEPDVKTDTITVNGVSFVMVEVEGGTFMMGATSEQGSDGYDSEKPIHEVTLSSYCIGQMEVTQELWQAIMGNNPSRFLGDLNRPVDFISWDDCQRFIERLNNLTNKQFRLPTEAEWEYAARGGKRSMRYKYAGGNSIDEVAWYNNNSDNTSHSVGMKKPNELNLYDMSGNVWEFCQDWFDYYGEESTNNPMGPSLGSMRVLRGGAWNDIEWGCRVSYRKNTNQWNAVNGIFGLRLALDIDSTKFSLSKTVVEIEDGECLSIGILNGRGNYTVYGDSTIVRNKIYGERLELTGMKEGITSIIVEDNETKAQATITAIVDAPVTRSFTVNGVTFRMIRVKGGTFTMGPSTHLVTLSDYYIAETEVTQELYRAITGTNPSSNVSGTSGDKYKRPVEQVNFTDILYFLQLLNYKANVTFRLPTEAEWEFAAIGGNKSHGYMFSGSNVANDVAWYNVSTQVVATKTPNELGLYDMTGNVAEFCSDWWAYLSSEPETNPIGPSTGTYRVIRGGHFANTESQLKVKVRNIQMEPQTRVNLVGFRFAMDQ